MEGYGNVWLVVYAQKGCINRDLRPINFFDTKDTEPNLRYKLKPAWGLTGKLPGCQRISNKNIDIELLLCLRTPMEFISFPENFRGCNFLIR